MLCYHGNFTSDAGEKSGLCAVGNCKKTNKQTKKKAGTWKWLLMYVQFANAESMKNMFFTYSKKNI